MKRLRDINYAVTMNIICLAYIFQFYFCNRLRRSTIESILFLNVSISAGI